MHFKNVVCFSLILFIYFNFYILQFNELCTKREDLFRKENLIFVENMRKIMEK
jgi:hypothetical protein